VSANAAAVFLKSFAAGFLRDILRRLCFDFAGMQLLFVPKY
jgi:hypothetical protein